MSDEQDEEPVSPDIVRRIEGIEQDFAQLGCETGRIYIRSVRDGSVFHNGIIAQLCETLCRFRVGDPTAWLSFVRTLGFPKPSHAKFSIHVFAGDEEGANCSPGRDHVGATTAFLATDYAKLMTGETVYADGGYHIVG